MSLKISALFLDASLRHFAQSAVATRTVSRGISPGCCVAFGKPCLSKHVAHSLQSRRFRYGILRTNSRLWWRPKDPLQQLLRRLGSWAVAEFCWKNHSSLLKRVVLIGFTTPCFTSSWYTQAHIYTFLPEMNTSHPDGKTYQDEGIVMASLHPQNLTLGTFEHISCCSGCYTSPQGWKFSNPRGYFSAHSRRLTGDALLLSVGSSSKQV